MSDFNLYEFPSDHVGRKTYVSIKGHSRSVPNIYVGYGADGFRHVLPEYGGDPANFVTSASGPMVMRDIGEYTSPLEANCRISSRSQHRDHMRKHGVIEVGNERVGRRQEAAPMSRAGHEIVRAMQGR